MRIVADLHTHSLASTHAYSTVDEICAAAARRGLSAVALTDHAPGMPDSPHEWHFSSLRRLPQTIHGVRFLSGAEVDVTDLEGTLNLPPRILSTLDFVIASMHAVLFPPRTADEHTQAWLAMTQSPYVDCLGHMGQPDFPFDIERVVRACRDSGTLIEINNASFLIRRGSEKHCRDIALACKKHECPVVVTSDAHTAYDVGDWQQVRAVLSEIDFPEELVINSSVSRLSEYFLQRKHKEIFPESGRDNAYWD